GEQVPTVAAPDSSSSPAAGETAAPAAPPVSQAAVEAGAQELDTKFGKLAAWNVVKREFPDWYGEQLRQAAALTAQKQPETAVNKHLTEATVALRRHPRHEARYRGAGGTAPPARQRSPRRQPPEAEGGRERLPQQSQSAFPEERR